MRACVVSDQAHVITTLGLKAEDYRGQEPIIFETPIQKKVHYYQPPDGTKKVPIPQELFEGTLMILFDIFKVFLSRAKIAGQENESFKFCIYKTMEWYSKLWL